MHKLLYILFAFSIISTTVSCENSEAANSQVVLASVNNVELTRKEVVHNIPEGLTGDDSLAFVKSYIDQWIQEQVVYQKAIEVLPDEAQNVDYQLEKYRRSLLIFTYEQYYIEDRLDTTVSEKEIEEFYLANQEDFVLRDYIVKAVYARYTNITPDLNKVSNWYKFTKPDDWVNLQSHANLYAVSFYNDTTNWIFFDDILKEIPLTDINKSTFIRNKKNISFEDNDIVYYVNILDAKLKDELSPLEFERDRIKGILINIRMNELRKELQTGLYSDAQKENKIKIFK